MAGTITGYRPGGLSGRAGGGLAFEPAADPGLHAALCRAISPEVFFPAPDDRATREVARSLCAACPVQAACLADAMASERGAGHSTRHGIRGGLTPWQRWKLYRTNRPPRPRRRRPGPAAVPGLNDRIATTVAALLTTDGRAADSALTPQLAARSRGGTP